MNLYQKMFEVLWKPIKDFLWENMPAYKIRGTLENMEMEIGSNNYEMPYPCIFIKIYPNGKGDTK